VQLAVIACSVLDQEVLHYAQGQTQILAVELMEQGLHNDPAKLRQHVQMKIDELETRHPQLNAIALVYGLCSRGTEGLVTRRCRLVIARAHDCITHLLGDRQRYAEYVRQHPGTYWYSPGWNKHHIPPGQERYEKLLAKYVEKYGQDNAEFLMESEQHWFSTYNRAAYVHLTIGATEGDIGYTRKCADWLKWGFDIQQGDPALLIALVRGQWDDERFLVLEPGQTLRMTADDRVVEAVPAPRPGDTHHA
jgi:hypothetical protein